MVWASSDEKSWTRVVTGYLSIQQAFCSIHTNIDAIGTPLKCIEKSSDSDEGVHIPGLQVSLQPKPAPSRKYPQGKILTPASTSFDASIFSPHSIELLSAPYRVVTPPRPADLDSHNDADAKRLTLLYGKPLVDAVADTLGNYFPGETLSSFELHLTTRYLSDDVSTDRHPTLFIITPEFLWERS
ncbi:hypothetical protein OQA88_62 [Cercophora sp. LCS_1]